MGEAENGEAAILKALQLQPDVVFLGCRDAENEWNGSGQIIGGIKKVPLIIFATAYPEFAAEAFRINAVDYLLKPYDEEQLKQTIDRIEKGLYPTTSANDSETIGNWLWKQMVKLTIFSRNRFCICTVKKK